MTDITELTSVQKNANIHRLSRLIAYAPNDELRQMAVEVEQYTDQLIEALEKAQHEARVDWEAAASLNVENQELKRRITELESRTVTVKLPQAVSTGGQGYQEQVERILTAAGIKWEAE